MTDCEHCGESFADEEAYLRHLGDEHPEEMGPIERRRLEALGGDGDGPTKPLVFAAIAVGALLLAIILYTLTIGGSNSDLGELGPAPDPPHDLGPAGSDEVYQPYQVGSQHFHGPIVVDIEGDVIDFRRPTFQHPRDIFAFHFEAGERRYHVHAQGVTLEYALEATAFGVTESSFGYDGVLYREGSNASAPDDWEVVTGATIEYRVNGSVVDPETHVIKPNERIEVTVRAPGDTSPVDENATTTNGSTNATVNDSTTSTTTSGNESAVVVALDS